MRRLAVLVLALTLPLAASADGGGDASRSVYHVGDSLAYGTSLYLKGYLGGWTVRQDVAVGMRSREALRLVRSAGSRLPPVVVVSAGTNANPRAVAPFSADVSATVDAAGPGRCVIWATVVRPPYRGVSYAAFNRELRALDKRYDTLQLLDWAAMVRAHPWWVSRDGIHGSLEAYRARARATAALVKRCP